jgi:hypothetical protein
MAKRSLQCNSFTPTATADGTNLADNTYGGVIQGGTSTQRNQIIEVMLTGQAGASSPTIMQLARDTIVGGTVSLGTGQTDAPLDAATAALAAAPITGNVATTKPQRSATAKLLNLAFNAFGGIIRWVAAPGEEITIVGNTQPLGEVSLSAYSGGTPGLTGSHVIYEPFAWIGVIGLGLLTLPMYLPVAVLVA